MAQAAAAAVCLVPCFHGKCAEAQEFPACSTGAHAEQHPRESMFTCPLLQLISVLQDEGGVVEESQLPAEPQHAAPPPIQPASTSGPYLTAALNMCRRLKSRAHGDCSHEGCLSLGPHCSACYALLDGITAWAAATTDKRLAAAGNSEEDVVQEPGIDLPPEHDRWASIRHVQWHMHCHTWHVAGSPACMFGDPPATFVTFSTLSRQQSCSLAHSEAPASCIVSMLGELPSLHAHSCA